MVFKGTGMVWDKERNKLLCKFENGEFQTQDERVKNILISLGYENDDDDEIVVVDENDEVIDEEEVRQRAKEAGIKSWHVKGIDKLLQELGE